jgi:hypothetical protein
LFTKSELFGIIQTLTISSISSISYPAMRFFIASTLAVLASIATATPTKAISAYGIEPSYGLQPGTEVKTEVTDVTRRDGNGASCKIAGGKAGTIGYDFTITTSGNWDDDWGKGLLDNLRGQCGWISDWGFDYIGGGQGQAVFSTTIWIRQHCVEDAIWLASSPTGAIGGVNCQW